MLFFSKLECEKICLTNHESKMSSILWETEFSTKLILVLSIFLLANQLLVSTSQMLMFPK